MKNLFLLLKFDIEGEEFISFAKIRYRAMESKAKVKIIKNVAEVEFYEPQRAITKGQSIVFYDENGIVLGGGIIS